MSDKIRSMFDSISDKYDSLNNVLSLGIHHIWRRKAVKSLNLKDNKRILDLATGTGDFAFEFEKQNNKSLIKGVDFSNKMLDIARIKSKRINSNVEFLHGDAMKLAFDSNSFDICSMGFGIRNTDDPLLSLKEIHRVLDNNGKLIILEFGEQKRFIKFVYMNIFLKIMPLIAKLFKVNKDAYTYLPESSLKFPSGEHFISLMKTAGFVNTSYKKYSLGICFYYYGEKA